MGFKGIVFCFLFLLGSLAGLAQQADGRINLADVTGKSDGLVRRIAVKSANGALERLMQNAFMTHGAYEVRSDAAVDFVFEFIPEGSGVTLVISSRSKELLRESFLSGTLSEAAYAAADLAVKRTVGLPGYFGSQLCFISKRTGASELYAGDLFFQGVRQLTRDRAICVGPNFNPDGSRVLYTSYHRNGFPDIYSIDLKKNERTTFSSYRGMNTGATASPDGRRVAMVLSGTGNSEIFVVNADGRQIQRLTRSDALEADPSWSPDGRKLIFTADDLGKPQIYMIGADGVGRRRIPTNISRNCSEPIWNPVNPDLIVFTAAIGKEFELCTYSFSTQTSTVISSGAGDAVEAVWLRDGRHLVFTERTKSQSRLAILDTVTGKKSYLSPTNWGHCSMADAIYLGGR